MSQGEHEVFASLIDSLERAEQLARGIKDYRPDQSGGWETIAQNLERMREMVYRVAMMKGGEVIQ